VLRAIEVVNDAAVIEASLRDPRAFAAVFDRHFEAVHWYARRRVGDEIAEEIAAETFTRAFDRRRRYDLRHADARPWLLGIAGNLLRRHWRTERRRLAAYARAGAGAPAAAADSPTDLAELAAALDRLSKDERDVLLLYALADLSYDEIALALDTPVGTVRSRLARARRRLRPCIVSPSEIEESSHA
jgi:RNA polymerase sigma factor (sigma-70 family)